MKRALGIVSTFGIIAGAWLTLSATADARAVGAYNGRPAFFSDLFTCFFEGSGGVSYSGNGSVCKGGVWVNSLLVDNTGTSNPIDNFLLHTGDTVTCATCAVSDTGTASCTQQTVTNNGAPEVFPFQPGTVTIGADYYLFASCRFPANNQSSWVDTTW